MESFYDREAGVAWGPITPEEMFDDIMRPRSQNIDRRRTVNVLPSYSNKEKRFMEMTNTGTNAQRPVINFFPDKEVKIDEPITISSDEEELPEQHLLENLKIGSPTPAKMFVENDIDGDDSSFEIELLGPTKQFPEADLVHKNYFLDEEIDDTNCQDVQIRSPTLQNYPKNEFSFSHENMFNDEPACSDLENRLPTPANLDNNTYNEIYKDLSDNEVIVEISPVKISSSDLSSRYSSSSEEKPSEIDQPGIGEISPVKIYSRNVSAENSFTSEENVKERDKSVLDVEIPPSLEKNTSKSDFSSKTNILSGGDFSANVSGIWSLEGDKDSGRAKENLSNVKQESNSPLLQEYPLNDDHDVFNDTLEEMERLLNQGINYSMKVDNGKTLKKKLPAAEDTFKSPAVSRDKPKILSDTKLNTLKKASPMCNKLVVNKKLIKLKIPITAGTARSNTKLPKSTLTPTNKMLTPNPTSTSLKRRFKNIESPVSVYIKNSGNTPVYKKLTPGKPLSCDKIKTCISDKTNKENSIVFPDVIYKPAKNRIVTTDAERKLPNRIVSLIPQKASVIKHQARIGGGINKDNSISRKLMEGDLTINSNITLNTTEDTSIHFNKKVYIP